MNMDFTNLTWTCHVCGDERPDSRISVLTKPLNFPGVVAEQNIRYCNDRETCRAGAEDYTFVARRSREHDEGRDLPQ